MGSNHELDRILNPHNLLILKGHCSRQKHQEQGSGRKSVQNLLQLKLEVERKLDAPSPKSCERLKKARQRGGSKAKNGIDLRDIRSIEEIEGLRDDIEPRGLSEWKILQNAKVHIRQHRPLE